MKKRFNKTVGRIEESLEIEFEAKYFFIHYKKGEAEKSAYFLKNEKTDDKKSISTFLSEQNVSEELKKDVYKFLSNETTTTELHWNEFTVYLIKMLSLNIVFGSILAICIFVGFKLGSIADNHFNLYPLFTLIGTFTGITVGGYSGYIMMVTYLHSNQKSKRTSKKERKIQKTNTPPSYPTIEVSKEQVREAIRKYSDELPKGVYRTILVNDDFSIDFQKLAHIFKGIPDKPFYMSKETYEIFEENEKEIPPLMDQVQKAVDAYRKDHRQYPILQFDPLRRVNYYLLKNEHYLDFKPDIEFYITDYDGIITHFKPKKSRGF